MDSFRFVTLEAIARLTTHAYLALATMGGLPLSYL